MAQGQARAGDVKVDERRRRAAARFGMWVFLATELMLFGPLFLGYVYARTHFPAAFAAASRHTDFWLGTINTGVLLTSSMAMALALAAHERAGPSAARTAARWLVLAALLGIAFLVIKGTEYGHDWQHHWFPGPRFRFAPRYAGGAELFYFLYFALTGLHALHLTIGVLISLGFALGLRLAAAPMRPPVRLELLGLYWHFVDLIWIFLYPILYLVGRSSAGG
ncbi:cytochrome c oxidase subunit 3 family protein [Massilia horti]|uniref:Cytochrome c oxidase subunit 3 family protein n=2 Tax=Massilia horti TaxID=2562153 RepID=A0A4Y9T0E7_9BURK|nr:cytochrome c oxidase subunit 3 family protein [Massilia horti]